MKKRKLSAARCNDSIVKLNVGGRVFHTTRNTLSLCEYFQIVLNGPLQHGTDEQGRLFIDRSPELFAIILQFLRTPQRPAAVTDKHALIHECGFFGVEWLAQILRGEISPYDLRPADRLLRQEEEQARRDTSKYQLIDVFSADTTVRPREDLQIPLLNLNKLGRPQITGTFKDFYHRLDVFSGFLITELAAIPNLVIAGGSILSALVNGSAGDLDVFLTVPPAEAEGTLRQIFAAVQKNQARSGGKKLLVTRTQNAVTMYRASGTNLCAPPVQVILQTYESMESLLLNFDIDSCCLAFRPGASSVYATERGLRALRFSCNVADTQHYSKSYCRRLEKYSGRGFAVGVPGLTPERFSTNITRASYVYILKEIDLILLSY